LSPVNGQGGSVWPGRLVGRPLLRRIRTDTLINPDKKQFPSFDEDLRSAMETETKLFFEAIIREDRSVLEFLDTNFTFVNARLAKHYGIPGVQGDQFQKVTLPTGERGGLLTQASILTVTSNPTRTSPVKRGRWILENLLNAPPPPPPKEDPAPLPVGAVRLWASAPSGGTRRLARSAPPSTGR
jgi:hypothetical protein